MKRAIKSIKTFRADIFEDFENDNSNTFENTQINENLSLRSFEEFNANNNIIKDITYDDEGNVEQTYQYIYNEQGKLIEEKLYYDDNELADHKKYVYNENGYIHEEIRYFNDDTTDSIIYKYDADNNIIEKTLINSCGGIDEKQIFEYKNKKITLEAVFDSEKKKFSENTYVYNEDELLIEMNQWDSDTNKKVRIVNFYNELKKFTKSLRYTDNVLTAKILYEYNSDNLVCNIIEEDTRKNNTLNIIYDEKANIIEETEINKEQKINHKIKRKYNENNDIIESEIFMDKHSAEPNEHYVIRNEYEYF